MPLLKGSTTVTAGVAVGTGLSKEIYDGLVSALGLSPLPIYDAGLKQIAIMANVISAKVIDHFKANSLIVATPTLTVPLGIAVSTAGTAAAQTGATTAPGTATGTVTSTLT